jgi:hypothetical protein
MRREAVLPTIRVVAMRVTANHILLYLEVRNCGTHLQSGQTSASDGEGEREYSRKAGPEMAQQCTVLLLKLRGSGFPVKDSGIEGSKADPFFQIRSNYALGNPHEGKHTTEYAYKSKKVLQDLNPKFKTIAIDLQKLVNMNMQQKLLFDFYDWDRFSSPDFMSYIELTPQQLLDQHGKPHGLPLRPPPAPHEQQVGELWVDRAELAYPQVHIAALSRTTAGQVTRQYKKWTGQVERGPDVSITNETSIPLKVLFTKDAELYRSATVGMPLGSHQNWTDLEAGFTDVFQRPDQTRECYILILSPNNAPLVLATFALGAYMKGSKTKPMSLSLDLDDNPASGSFPLARPAPPVSVSSVAGLASVAPDVSTPGVPAEGPANPAEQRRAQGFKVTMSLKLRGNDLPVKDSGLLGGKSDPFFEIRPAFGAPGGITYVSPNKDSRGNDLPKRSYEGKHQTRPFVKSEVVLNQLNPSWKTILIELNELILNNDGGFTIDLSKKVLIDVWDWDRGGDCDFMCYCEVSLLELIDAVKSKAPLPLLPPPEGHEQNVGRLYVDRADVGYPLVDFRASTSKEQADALVIRNLCPVPLKVLVEDDPAMFACMRLGQTVQTLQHDKCIVISVDRFGLF